MTVAAVVLAAGGSSRANGKNKLLFPIDGEPMIARVCRRVVKAGFHPVIVVTGYEKSRIRGVLEDQDVMTVHNDRWKDGMSASIRVGLGRVPAEAAGVSVVLGDMPFVTVRTLGLLWHRFVELAGKKIVYPTHGGRQGNPVLFPRQCFREILAITGDRGCKVVLNRHMEDAVSVPVKSKEILLDCDTESDVLQQFDQISHESTVQR
ncbi:MAG: NTP transferase domain-containing protein [Fidelibacterota bacterium]